MKRLLALLLIVTMLVSVACSAGESKKEASTEDKQSTTTKQNNKKDGEGVKKEEPVVIEWLGANHDVREKSEPILDMEEKYNCTFNFWNIDAERYLELLGVKLASGEMPDTFMIEPDTTMQPFIKQGVAAEITEEIFSRIPNYTKVYEPFNKDGNLFVDTMNEGKIYGLKEVNLTGSYPTILVWNKKWLKNVGITKIPETLSEFEEAMYKFVNEDPDGNGKKDTYGMSQTVMNAVFGAYGPIPLKEFRGGKGRQKCFMFEESNELKFAVTQPSMKEALVKLQQWYKDGIIDPEFITGENTGGYWAISQAFANQRIGVTGMVMPTHWNPPLTSNPSDEGRSSV